MHQLEINVVFSWKEYEKNLFDFIVLVVVEHKVDHFSSDDTDDFLQWYHKASRQYRTRYSANGHFIFHHHFKRWCCDVKLIYFQSM